MLADFGKSTFQSLVTRGQNPDIVFAKVLGTGWYVDVNAHVVDIR